VRIGLPAVIEPTASTQRPATQAETAFAWLVGDERLQRSMLTYWVEVNTVYVLLIALQWYAVSAGLASVADATLISIYLALNAIGFYIAQRSGWSLRFADPALTMPQMIFGLGVIFMAYLANSRFHTMTLLMISLVLVVGALTLSPRNCRLMGAFSLVGLAVTILIGVTQRPQYFELGEQLIVFLFSVIILACVAELAARISAIRAELKSQRRELKKALAENQWLAGRDELTGLSNRRRALELLAYEERRAVRQPVDACIAMIDLDLFKSVNDKHGHGAGDDVLRTFARHAGTVLREADILARWGGEEFLLLMPNTSKAEAERVIERLREIFCRAGQWHWSPDLIVTFSAGLTTQRHGETSEVTITRADEALYRAKARGRNSTVSEWSTLTA
jgi:diguanylate cyclase